MDTLRKKRVRRLGVKSVGHTGQRRVFSLFDRATKKFAGDLGLWMQYLEYARRQKALKKVAQILTAALRLHPQKSELWMYAARFALEENSDMMEARGYMQRGLRFCRSSRNLWLEYMKLELLYISKIASRHQILGISSEKQDLEDSKDAGSDEDMIRLPKLTQNDIAPSDDPEAGVDKAALLKLEQSPLMTGAVPIAIFDAAMKQFDNEEALAKSFYDVVDEVQQIGCKARILEHIVKKLLATSPQSWQSMVCHIKVAVPGIPITSPEFPLALGSALSRARQYLPQASGTPMFVAEVDGWLGRMLEDTDLDPALVKVIDSTRSMLKQP